MIGTYPAFVDTQGPFAGGNAYDMISPHQRAAGGGGDVTGPDTAAAHDAVAGGNPVGVIIGMLGALVLLGWVVNGSAALSGKLGFILTPVYWLFSILGTMVGIVIVKLLLARFPVPGLTPVVNIV